jgi:hypothetical protein
VYRFGKVSCLVCFAIFGRFWRFGGKWISREIVPEMTELGRFLWKVERMAKNGQMGRNCYPLSPLNLTQYGTR